MQVRAGVCRWDLGWARCTGPGAQAEVGGARAGSGAAPVADLGGNGKN